MNRIEFPHEADPVFQHARELYSAASALARTSSRWLNQSLRRHSLRILEHATSAGDAPSVGLRAQALRYAKMSTLKLCADIEAVREERQSTDDVQLLVRRRLLLLLAEIDTFLGKPPTRQRESKRSEGSETSHDADNASEALRLARSQIGQDIESDQTDSPEPNDSSVLANLAHVGTS